MDRRGESLLFVRDANMLEIWERVCCQAKAKENGGLGTRLLTSEDPPPDFIHFSVGPKRPDKRKFFFTSFLGLHCQRKKITPLIT